METQHSTSYVTGLRFAAFQARLWIRLARRLTRDAGVAPAVSRIGRYLLRKSSLTASMPLRLVRHQGHTWAVPDLPPLDGDAFLDSLVREITCAVDGTTQKPVTAIVSLTGRCPHHCAYCYVDPVTREAEEPPVDLLTETVLALAELGVFTFHFSGGEPALRTEDLVDLLRRVGHPDLCFWMLTTGSGLDAAKLDHLAHAGLTGVMISLDSHDLTHVNRLKGSPDAFHTAAQTMRGARQAGLLVAVNAVMNRLLLREEAFSKFIDTAGELGASFVNCYAPRPQAEALPPELAPFTVDEYRQLDRLTRRCNASGRHRPLAYTPDLWEAIRGCQGGRGFLYIDPAGEVRRCPFLRKSYGNIREGRLGAILARMQADPAPEVCAGNRMLTDALRTGTLR